MLELLKKLCELNKEVAGVKVGERKKSYEVIVSNFCENKYHIRIKDNNFDGSELHFFELNDLEFIELHQYVLLALEKRG